MPSGVYKHKKGYKRPTFSLEWRKKLSIAGKGKIISPETRKKMGDSKRGRKLTEEQKEKIRQSVLKLGNSKYTPEVRKKMSELLKKNPRRYWLGKRRPDAKRGSDSHFWKGGITSVNQIIRVSADYKAWRKAVFERDNYTCIWCGLRSGNDKAVELQADHIKPFYQYPALRFAIDNGRTLCRDCHKKTDTFGGKSNKKKYV